MRKVAVLFVVLSAIALAFSNQLGSVIPSMDVESVTLTLVFNEPFVQSYNIQSNPSKTIYSLSLNGVNGKDMNLPLRMGPVEGLWIRQEPSRLSINTALLTPARVEPEIIIRENVVIIRFFRSSAEVDIDKFTTYGMTIASAMTYLFSEEILNLSYILSPSVRDEKILVGFTLALPEEILRNILTSLGDRVAYAYLSDGTFYLGTPDEVRELVNTFWRTYVGVEFNVDGETVSEQVERLRKTLPVNSFIEYLPNEASLMVFGDLQTHFMLSSLLTTNIVTKEFAAPSEATPSGVEPLEAYEALARELNSVLFSDSITISTIPQFNRLILTGNSKYVDELFEYLELYRKNLTSENLDSSRTRITYTLPENFFLVEDVLRLGSTAGSGLPGDGTIVGTILNLLQSYSKDSVTVDRTFEPVGKVTFDLPKYLVEFIDKTMESFDKISGEVTYSVIKYHMPVGEETISQVEKITGAVIETIGEKKGYIIKGSKASIETAQYVLSLFTGITFEDYRNTYIELKAENKFNEVKSFFDSYFASRGLVVDEYSLEQISEKLIYIYAPSDILDEALTELENREKQIFRKTEDLILEVAPEIYDSGLGELIDTLLNPEESQVFIRSAGLIVLRGYPERLSELEKIIEARIPRIVEMIEKRLSGQETRMSLQIGTIPGWDLDKFQTYLRDFLGPDEFATITVTRSGNGYIVVGPENLLNTVDDETRKLRELENPFYRLESSIPSLSQFELLLERLGVAVSIMPVDNQFMVIGSQENVEEASRLIRQLGSGLPVGGEVTVPGTLYNYAFVNVPYGEVAGLSELLEKLNLPVEFVNTPTGVAAVAPEERLKKAMEVVESILSRLEPVEAGPVGYSLVDVDPGSLESLKTIIEKLRIEVDFVDTPSGIVGIGSDAHLDRVKKLIEDLLKKESVTPPQGDKETGYMIFRGRSDVSVDSLKSVVQVFGYDLTFTSVYDKIVAVGDRYDLNSFNTLYGEILSSESVEDTRVSVELPGIPGWDTTRLSAYLGVVFGEKAEEISLVQTSKGYILNAPGSMASAIGEEFERLSRIENPSYSIETRMPNITEIDSLLARLGIIVDILQVEDYSVVVGSSENVAKARELITKLVDTLGVPEQTKPQVFKLSAITSGDVEYFVPIFGSIDIEVALLESPAGILIVGKEDQVNRALEIADSILERKPSQEVSTAYEFVDIPSDGVTTYGEILKRLGLSAELFPSPSGVLLIGSEEDIDKARPIIEAILEREAKTVSQSDEQQRVSMIVKNIPGWTEDKFTGYFRSLLGESEFAGISITPSVSGFIVIGEEKALAKMQNEVVRLSEIEDPFYLVKDTLPPVDQLDRLLERLGLNVSILPVGEKNLIVGVESDVIKTGELIDTLKTDLDTGDEKYVYRFSDVNPQLKGVLESILSSLKIEVGLTEAGNSMAIVGLEKEVDAAKVILDDVAGQIVGDTAKGKIGYSFVGVESSQIDSYSEILDRLEYEVDLLSSPSGVLVIGEENAVRGAVEMINAILAREEEIESKVGESVRVSTVLSVVPGWSDEKYSGYFRDYLGEDDFGRISITPSTGGYIVIGPQEVLERMEKEAERLTSIEDPYYVVEETLPAIEELDTLLERLGLKVTILPIEDRYLVVGKRESVEKASQFISTLKAGMQPAVEEPQVFEFVEIEAQYIDSLERTLEELKVKVQLIQIGNNVVMIGSSKDLEAGRELLAPIAERLKETPVEKKVTYSFVGVESSQIDSYSEILDRLEYEVDLLSSPSGVLVIGEENAVRGAVEMINAILAREEEIESKVGESVRVSTVLSVVPGWDQQKTFEYFHDFLGEDEYSRVSLTPSAGGYIVVGPEETLKKLETEVSRLTQLEHPFFTIENSIPALDKFEQLLTTLGIKVNIIVLEDKYLIVGTRENVISTSELLQQIIETVYSDDAVQEEPPVELGFTLIEAMAEDIPVLASVVTRLGIPVDLVGISTGAILIGQADRLEEASGVIESILKHRESLYSKPELDYRFVDIQTQLIDQLLPVMQKLEIQVELLETPTGVIAIGTPQELSRATGLVDSVMSREVPEIPQKEKYESYLLLPLTQGLSVDALTQVLETFEYEISLLGISDKLIAIGREEDLVKFKSLYKSLQAQEIDRESRVSIEIKSIPGWTAEDFGQYTRFFLGADDFARISILESLAGYVVLTPLDLKEPIESEVERIRGFEDPEFVVKEKLPPVEDLTGLLARLGIIVDLVPMGSSAIIIGSSDAVQRAGEIVDRLMGSLVVETVVEEPLEYRILDIPEEDTASLQNILDRLGVDVSLLSSSSGVIAIGTGSTIEKASGIAGDILSKRISAQVEEPVYTFTEIPLADIQSYQAILNRIGAGVELLPSPSGVLIVGTGERVEKALKTVNAVLAREVEMSSAGEQPRRVSTVLSVVPGWSDEKYSGYFRDYLGEDDFGRISITPSTGGYIVIGPQEVLERMEKEAERLTSIEDPYYVVEETLPAIEELDTLLERLGLKVTILPIEDRYLVVGKRESVEKASQFISTLKAGMQPAVEEPQVFEFVEIETQYIDSLERTLEELKVKVQLIQIGNNVVMIGSSKDLEAGRELLAPIAERLKETPVEKKVTYSFVGVESSQIDSYSEILDRLEYEVDLLSSPSGVLVIGEENAVRGAVEMINAILAREEEIESKVGESVRVSTVLSVVPGWSDEKYSGYFRDYLGEDDFGRISITPSTGGYIVIGPQEVLERMEKEAERLTSIEDPYYVVEETLPAIEELDTLLERLGLKVTILPIEDRYLVVGKRESVEKASQFISTLKAGMQPAVEEPQVFEFVEIETQYIDSLERTLEELKVKVQLIQIGNNVVMIGSSKDLEAGRELLAPIAERLKETPVEKKVTYSFVGVESSQIDSYSEILDRLEYEVDLLSSPSGVLVIGEENAVRGAVEMINAILAREEEIESKVGESVRVSTVLSVVPGWSDEKYSGYFRDYLGEDDFGRISITPSTGGYIVIGPQEVLERMEKEAERLTSIEDPYYVVEETLPAIEELDTLLERLGLKVTILPIEDRYLVVGKRESVEKASQFISTLKAGMQPAVEEPQVFEFVEIETQYIDSLERTLEELKVKVQLIQIGNNVVMIGSSKDLEAGRELLAPIAERLKETPVEKKVTYSFVGVESSQIDSYSEILDRLEYEVDLLSSPSGVLVIGEENAVRGAVEMINAILAREEEIESKVGESVRVSTVLSVVPGWSDEKYSGYFRDYLGEDDFGRISITPSTGGYIVIGPQEVLERMEKEAERLTSIEDPYYVVEETLPAIEELDTLLERLGLKVTILPIEDRYLVVGKRESVEKASQFISTLKAGMQPAVEEPQVFEFVEIEAQYIDSLERTLEELKVKVQLIQIGNNVVMIGSSKDLEAGRELLAPIAERLKETPVEKKVTYSFVGVESSQIDSYSEILDRLEYEVDLLSSPSGVLVIGEENAVRGAVEMINAILAREEEIESKVGESVRVSTVLSVVPGWSDEKYSGYFRDYLGEDDFGRISITPSTGGYIVIGPQEVLERMEKEAERLTSIEDPYYVVEETLPAIEELDTLLERLGLKVTILPIEDRYLVVGKRESVTRTVDLIQMLRRDVESPLASREYEYTILEAGSQILETVRQVLEEMKIDVTVIGYGNNMIIVGYREALDSAVNIISSISDRTDAIVVDEKLKYVFTEIPADKMDEFSSILDNLKLPVKLLSSPSGVILVGEELETEKALEVVQSILSKSEIDETVESRLFNNLAGWEEGKLTTYLRSYLGEKDWVKISITSIQSGYLIVGPSGVLDRIQKELSRLTGLEKPHYRIIDSLPTVQNLELLFERMGLSITVVITDGKTMLIGPERDVLQALKVLDELKEDVEITQTGEEILFTFIDIPTEEIENFKAIFERLAITVDILGTPTGTIVVGVQGAIDRARETATSILSRREAQIVPGEQSYLTLEIRDGFDLAAAQSVISAFNLNVYPLSVAGKLVMIGAQSELERFLTIRNDIVDEHRITVIVPREVTLEELNGIKDTLKLDVSVFEMRSNFVVYGKEQDISSLRSILNEVVVKQPVEETPQIEMLTNVGVDLDYLREILSSMGITIKVYGEGDSIVAVGKPSDLNSLKNLLKKIGSASTATEPTVSFYPLLEGWTGDILSSFLQAMNVDVLVFQENRQGYLLIGVREDLDRVKVLLDGLEIKIKKVTELYAIPSGMSFEELRDILLSSGFNLSYTRLGQSMSVSGPEEDVKMAIAMLDEVIRSGLGKVLSYTLIDLPTELTLEKFQKIMTDMGLSVSTVQIDSRLMLIGSDSDLRKAGDIVEYLRPEEVLEDSEKIYSVVALPEALTIEETVLLAERLGLNVEILPVAGNMVVIGTRSSVDSFKSLVTTISGALGAGSKETVSYRISSLPAGVGLTEFESLLDSLKISSRIVQVSDSIVFVGTGEENALAEKLLSEFRPEEVPVQDVTREYTTISMPPGFDLASLSGILEKIGLEADLTLAGNVLVLVGDAQSLPKVVSVISDLHGTGSRPEVMKLAYEVIDVPADMNIDVVNEAINSLKIPSTIIRNGDKLLVTGSSADIEETRRLVEIFRPEQSAEPVEKTYRLLSLPSGFTVFDVETALGKTGIELELLQVGNVLLLAGKAESLDEAESLLEKLIMVSTGDTGERNTYEIVKIREGVTTQLLGQLFRLIGISVEILESEDWMVFTGSEGSVKAALDVFESLAKDVGGTEEPLSYTITILPKNLTIGQLQTAFESIQISIRLIEAGDYAIMVGTKDSLNKGQQLISSLRIGVDASGTSTDGSISYVTFAIPVGTEIDQLETIAGLMELKLKFQIVGDRVFMIGTEKDMRSFEEILKGLVVEETGVINQFRFVKAITGIDSVTLDMYLTAKGIELAGIYDVSGGYLLVGDSESIDLAQVAVNYIADNQRVHFDYIDLPENFDPGILQKMAEDLLLGVSLIQVSPSRYMLIGAAEDVQNLITVIFQAAGTGEKLLDYSMVVLSPTLEKELDLDAFRNILAEIGIKVSVGRFSGRLIFVGKPDAIEASTNLLEKLRSSMEEDGIGKLAFYELPVVGGWSIADIQNYLEAAGIKLSSVIEYAGRIVGIGTQNDLAMAEEALLFIASKAARESVRIDKGLVTQIQLSEMISKLNLKAEFVELDKQWLLIGDPDSLMKLTRTIEEAAADREISRYVTDLTVDPQELASLLREAIDGLTVQTFENLQMILLKSKSSVVLDNTEAMIKSIQESRKAVDPVEKGVTVSGSKVGINVVNQDLERLLRVVAEKLDIPLLFIDVIDENITMSVKEIEWESLVKVINATKPVSISRIDDIYAVTKKEQKSGQEATDIELVYRVYHNVEEVTKLIEFYGGEVLSDAVNGYIVVRGLAKSKVDSIFEEIASSLAKPKKQVRIETKLVDKSLVDEMQRDFNTAIGITNPDVIIQNGSIDLSFKVFENLDISKILNSIVNTANASIGADLRDRDVDSDLISSPSIVSMSGEEATIHIGDTIPYLVKKIEYVDGRPVEIETIENLNTGVELRITPTVNDDGKILLDLYIKVSEPEKYVDGTRTLYGEKTREAKSKLVIGDGNTLTIGGLVANKDSVNVNKMPFLSDLPFIGKLFTTETKTTDKRELVIFITAEVVQP